MDDQQSVSSRTSLALDLPPSCVEFCPSSPNHFVVGTYNLERNADAAEHSTPADDDDVDVQVSGVKKAQSRNGSLILFEIKNNDL